MSENVFNRAIRPTFPPDCIRREGGRVWFYTRGCIDAWAASQSPTGGIAAAEGDPLLRGPNTAQLERYRRLKADMVELDLAERKRTLIPRAEIHAALGQIAGILRSASQALGREFGARAQELLLEALEDCDREIQRMGVTE